LIERVDDWIIVTSRVSSFGGAAASSLISIGADVAFVAAKKDDLVKVSARARREAQNAGVNLAKIMEEISVKFKGTGGGHEGAAGMDVLERPKTYFRRVLSMLKTPCENIRPGQIRTGLIGNI